MNGPGAETGAAAKPGTGRGAAPFEAILAYFADPDPWWQGAKRVVQGGKARAAWARWTRAFGEEAAVWAGPLHDALDARAGMASVHVTGLGGSGSHWLGHMLAEDPRFHYCGEVYFPPRLARALSAAPAAAARAGALLFQLLHGPPVAASELGPRRWLVNTAAGVQRADLYRAWEPLARVIYLVRDPRDQVLSTTFRKAAHRVHAYPGVDDAAYLALRIRSSQRSAAAACALAAPPTLTVRYEDLRRDGPAGLTRAFAAVGAEVAPERAAEIAALHDADRIRQGLSQARGNLDEGGVSRGWRADAPAWALAEIHVRLQDPILRLGYVLPDIWEVGPGLAPRRAAAPAPDGCLLIGLFAEGWRALAALDEPAPRLGLRIDQERPIDAALLAGVAATGAEVVSLAGSETAAKADFDALPPLPGLAMLDAAGIAGAPGLAAWAARCAPARLRFDAGEGGGQEG